jgi:acyl-CoA carboxylase subunit beta
MGVLGSRLDPGSDAYQANRAANLELLEELDRLLAEARAGGGRRYVDRHRARGKLLARERIELLLDRDGPFLELSPLAAWGTDFPVGASGVTGIGPVAGVECVVVASDPTVRGGATNPFGLRKTLRAMEIAERNRLPLVQLIESSGADLPTQSQIFIPGGACIVDDLGVTSGLPGCGRRPVGGSVRSLGAGQRVLAAAAGQRLVI